MWARWWWNKKKEKALPAPSQRACVSVQNNPVFQFLASFAGHSAPPRLQTVTTAPFTHDSCTPWRSEVAAGGEAGTVLRLLEASAPPSQKTREGKQTHGGGEKRWVAGRGCACLPFAAGERKRERNDILQPVSLGLSTGTRKHLLDAAGFAWCLMPELHCEGHSRATWQNNIPYINIKGSLYRNEDKKKKKSTFLVLCYKYNIK